MKEDDVKVLTMACRFSLLKHEDCVGQIYFGSIFGEPSKCECDCHATRPGKLN